MVEIDVIGSKSARCNAIAEIHAIVGAKQAHSTINARCRYVRLLRPYYTDRRRSR